MEIFDFFLFFIPKLFLFQQILLFLMISDVKQKEMLNMYIGKEITLFVRYGFKKRIEETQSYKGIFIHYDHYGMIIERNLRENEGKVHDFFPWHNIDCVRVQL